MTIEFARRAMVAARTWLAGIDSPESAIVAHEADDDPGDGAARRWIRRTLEAQDPDGSWSGDLAASAEQLLIVRDLTRAAGLLERDPAIGRTLDWLRRRQGAPGVWTGGCSPERHRRGLCHHFAAGFYSPGPPEVRYEVARLRSGARLRDDGEIRFVASTLALRCVLSWDVAGTDAGIHLEALRRIVNGWTAAAPEGLTQTGLLSAVHALLGSGAAADREAAARGLEVIAVKQRGDGSWVEADAFQALEVFGSAHDAGIATERTSRALSYGARLLLSTQQADGSWGPESGARRALIAWRTFRRADRATE